MDLISGMDHKCSTPEDELVLELLRDVIYVKTSLANLETSDIIAWHKLNIKEKRYGKLWELGDRMNPKAAIDMLHYINFSVWKLLNSLKELTNYPELHL